MIFLPFITGTLNPFQMAINLGFGDGEEVSNDRKFKNNGEATLQIPSRPEFPEFTPFIPFAPSIPLIPFVPFVPCVLDVSFVPFVPCVPFVPFISLLPFPARCCTLSPTRDTVLRPCGAAR